MIINLGWFQPRSGRKSTTRGSRARRFRNARSMIAPGTAKARESIGFFFEFLRDKCGYHEPSLELKRGVPPFEGPVTRQGETQDTSCTTIAQKSLIVPGNYLESKSLTVKITVGGDATRLTREAATGPSR